MTANLPNFFLALPELFLLVAASALMIFDARRKGAGIVLAQAILVICALLAFATLPAVQERPMYTFSGLFVNDVMAGVLKIAACLALFVTLIYSRAYLSARNLLTGEFLTLLLFSLLGIMVMMSANSFLTLYLGLELLSLSLYAMVALNRDSAASTEAAMKYFVLGALASGLLLYGMSMIYGATGSLNLNDVASAVARLSASKGDRTFLVFGLVFVVCGLAFKLGVAPFHMWIPDVYHGAPTAVTLVIGTAPKLAAFAMAIRLLVNGLLDLAMDWQQMLAILAVLSMAIGNITAIAQTNIKRMLAYSTIAHMGFMLLGLASGVVGGNLFSAGDAYVASMFYTVVYVLMSLGAFGMVVFLSREGFECERLEDFKGLNKRSPWYAFIMLVLMFSLAGLPPTAGFYAKLGVLAAAVNAGQIWLAVTAVVLSLVGAFYYLRVVKLMYFDEPDSSEEISGCAASRLFLSANGIVLLLLGILPQPLLAVCVAAIRGL